MKTLRKIITISVVGIVSITPIFSEVQLSQDKKEFDILKNAKHYLYQENWKTASEKLEAFTKNFPNSKYIDDALYWEAYSLNKWGDEQKTTNQFVTLKEKAIEKLNRLTYQCKNSSWLDDAKILRVEISYALIKKGKEDYKKYVANGVESHDEANIDLRIVALDTMMNINREKTLPVLQKMIKENKNPQIRKKGLMILRKYFDKKTIPLLSEVAANDPDKGVRKEALSCLNQISNREGDFELQMNIHSGYAILKNLGNNFSEDRINVLPLQNKWITTAGLRHIGGGNKLLPLSPSSFSNASWMKNGFLIQPSLSADPNNLNAVIGKIEIKTLENNKLYSVDITVEKGKPIVAGLRRGKKVALVTLQIKEKNKPKYSTIFHGDTFTVYSSDTSWSDEELSNAKIPFNNAIVHLSTEKGELILISKDVDLFSKKKQLIAKNATLLNSEGNILAEGNKIVIKLDHPMQYRVENKK